MLAPTIGWKLINHHKTYLSVQCDNVQLLFISSYNITCQCLTTLVVQYLFRVGLALEGFSYVKPKRSTRGTSRPRYQTSPRHRSKTAAANSSTHVWRRSPFPRADVDPI